MYMGFVLMFEFKLKTTVHNKNIFDNGSSSSSTLLYSPVPYYVLITVITKTG